MANYSRRRYRREQYNSRRQPLDRVYVARVVRDPYTQIDYTQFLAPSVRREITRGVKPARRAAAPGGRIVAKRDARGASSYSFTPGAAYLGDTVPSTLTLSERKPRHRTAELCKCKHERSEEQRRQSRKFFSGYGGRGLPKVQHVCHCA